MKTTLSQLSKGAGAALMLAALASCGGSGPGGTTTTGTTGGTGGSGSTSDTIELGNTSGGSFTNAVLAISPASITASGNSTITANIFDATTSAAYAQSATVTFSSTCSKNGSGPALATFTPASVNTSNGTASSTYQSTGCTGTDTITAQTTINGKTLSATGTIAVASASVGGLVLVSAAPSVISLQGVGGVTTSVVTFQLNDINGNPISSAQVDFSLNTTAGGIGLNPASGTTNSKGQVSTNITSGTVHTSLNITATVHGTTTSISVPNVVSINTGPPVESAFSLAIVAHNVEAYRFDGTTDAVTVHLADRYGNPVNDGTAVDFTTNGGSIVGSCATTGGQCTVNWTSQNPRPTTSALEVQGHAHILAYAEGEEHFQDANSDNVFDNGDYYSEDTTAPSAAQTTAGCTGSVVDSFFGPPAQDDIGDPYMDSKEVGCYIPGETFFDINNSSTTTRRTANQQWFGVGCGGFGSSTTSVNATSYPPTLSAETITCANTLTMIGEEDCIVMSEPGVVFLDSTKTPITAPIHVPANSAVLFYAVDTNGNVPAATSPISVNMGATAGAVAPNPPIVVPDIGCRQSIPFSAGTPIQYAFVISTTASGTFNLSITSPVTKTVSSSPTIIVP